LNPVQIKIAAAGWQPTIDEWGRRVLARWDEITADWALAQFGIIAASYLIAVLLSRVIVPRLEARLRKIKQQPSLLRILVVFLRRTKWILFALLLVLTASVMAPITWPSHSYFVKLAASLATAWALISTLSRVIRNRRIGNAIAILAWSIVALLLTGLIDSVVDALDAASISVAGFRLSVLIALKAIFLFSALLWLALLISDVIDQRLMKRLEIDAAIAVLIGKLIRAALLFIVIFASFAAIGIDLTAFAVFSGAVGLGIGFGLQKVASNLISGFIILLDRSIKPGDVISLGSTFGWITALGARYVQVNTRDGVEYLIPNETFITERLANMSHSNRSIRLDLKFGVSYASDPHEVRALATTVVAKLPRVMTHPEPVCHIVGFGDSSLDFLLRFWIQDPENGLTNVRGEAFLGLWDAFKENKVEIPYPHREVFLRTTQNAPRLDVMD
jgi:small-conductance mechanosensitive channel